MQRLVKPVSDGGVPYNNFNLYGFLQENHLISYSSFLDGMNDEPNSGIILYGCTFVTSSAQDCVFDFTNSMVYLQGDFRQASPLIATQSFGISSLKFYLVPDTDTPNEQRVFKVTDLETDIATYNYFNYSISKPTDTEYIEIEIKNGLNITSRHLSRIMRYYNAEQKQVFMTRSKNFFDSTGLGFGEMKGFQLCNGQNSSQNLSGKYLIGYKPPSGSTLTIGWNTSTHPNTFTNSSQNPADPTKQVTIRENYNYLKNTGGNDKVFLFGNHLPPHKHGDTTGPPSNDLSHSHEITVSRDIWLNGSKSDSLNQFAYQGNRDKYGVGNADGDGDALQSPLTLTTADYNLIFPPTNSYFGIIGKKLQPSSEYSYDYKLISTMKTPRGGFVLRYLNLNQEETNWVPIKDSIGNWVHKGDNISWEVTNPEGSTNYVQLPLFQTQRPSVQLENHVHLIDKFQFSAANLPYGLSHDNLPPYYVVAYYQKI